MKNTYVVDANVVLRYLLADHEEHSQLATEFMSAVKTGAQRIYVPESVLAECVYVLIKVYKVPRAEAAEQLIGLLSYKGVMDDTGKLLRDALRLFIDKNVDIVDAIVFTTAQAKHWDVFSFDKDIKRLEK